MTATGTTGAAGPGDGALAYAERPADGEASGLLVLHHGRGSDERDLLGLADALDPERRLHVVTPRAPLRLPGSPGYHWYVVPRVGYPDHDTFHHSVVALGAFHDALARRTGIPPARTILGGFSQGSVMSYALGLAAERPAPAGLLIFSGFLPVVDGWEPAAQRLRDLPVFVAHGRSDPIMDVSLAHRARERLSDGGAALEYHESAAGHFIDPDHLAAARTWLAGRAAPDGVAGRAQRA